MTTANDVIKKIKDNDIKYVDFRFTDPRGKWQHVTFDVSIIDADALVEGIAFDGSSIAGWKAINESDMLLIPDLATATLDPFFAASTLVLVCNVVEPTTGARYNRDPRGIARKAEEYLKSTGVGDSAFFRPEAEFFVFDDVRFSADPYNTGFSLDSSELPSNSSTAYEGGNLGHRVRTKGGYFPVPPVDSAQDMRGEMLAAMAAMGVQVEKHHHEVASAQHELGLKFAILVTVADHLQIYKYAIHQVANSYGKTATFMPKPVYGDNGSGMHVHQSIWKAGQPVFAGDKYAGLSQECLWYIGGVIKHAKALNAFTNPSTNSYKRLVPGFEAPVLLAYSSRNRSALPHPLYDEPEGQARRGSLPRSDGQSLSRLRGHANGRPRRHRQQDRSGRARRQGSLPSAPAELKAIPTVCGSLREALDSLKADHAFPGGRRVQPGLHRILYRSEVSGRSTVLRNDPASGRITGETGADAI